MMTGSRSLQGEEDKDLGPDACAMRVCVDTKRLKRGQNHKDGRPSMVKRERQVNKQFITPRLGRVELFDFVVDMLK